MSGDVFWVVFGRLRRLLLQLLCYIIYITFLIIFASHINKRFLVLFFLFLEGSQEKGCVLNIAFLEAHVSSSFFRLILLPLCILWGLFHVSFWFKSWRKHNDFLFVWFILFSKLLILILILRLLYIFLFFKNDSFWITIAFLSSRWWFSFACDWFLSNFHHWLSL